MNNSDDTIVLSYHDSLLRNRDVDLLRGRHWLNDAIISFYFEYLQRKHDDANGEAREMFFVGPELTQLLKLTDPAMWCDLMGPPNERKNNYTLFPLNNCESRDAAGGSHWSLLIHSSEERTSFHLDSCGGTNELAAARFAKKITNYHYGSGAEEFEEMPCPPQENGYDCGLFVLCLADSIFRQISEGRQLRNCDFKDVPSAVRTKRKDLLELIEKLKNSSRSQ